MRKLIIFCLILVVSCPDGKKGINSRNDSEFIDALKRGMVYVNTYESGDGRYSIDRWVNWNGINRKGDKCIDGNCEIKVKGDGKVEFLGLDKHFYNLYDFKYLKGAAEKGINVKGSNDDLLVEVVEVHHPVGACLRYDYEHYEPHICCADPVTFDDNYYERFYFYDDEGDMKGFIEFSINDKDNSFTFGTKDYTVDVLCKYSCVDGGKYKGKILNEEREYNNFKEMYEYAFEKAKAQFYELQK